MAAPDETYEKGSRSFLGKAGSVVLGIVLVLFFGNIFYNDFGFNACDSITTEWIVKGQVEDMLDLSRRKSAVNQNALVVTQMQSVFDSVETSVNSIEQLSYAANSEAYACVADLTLTWRAPDNKILTETHAINYTSTGDEGVLIRGGLASFTLILPAYM